MPPMLVNGVYSPSAFSRNSFLDIILERACHKMEVSMLDQKHRYMQSIFFIALGGLWLVESYP